MNPKYDEVDGQPCYPDLAALPEVPDTVAHRAEPAACRRSSPRRPPTPACPAVVIPGGGVVEGGEAAARCRPRSRDDRDRGTALALLGPNCMGMVDLTTNSATYIGDVNPWLPRGGVAGIAQSGCVTDAFIHSGTRIGFSRIVGCGAEVVLDVCDYLAHCLDDDETHAVILFVEGFKRPERFLALADRALALGKPILAVKVGRSRQAQAAAVAHSGSLAGEDRVTDAALARRRRHPLRRPRRAARGGRARRRLPAARPLGRARPDRGRDGLDGRGVAHRRPRAANRARPAARPGRRPRRHPRRPADDRLHRQPDRSVGRRRRPRSAYAGASPRRSPSSGAYDVLALVHDFPYRSLPRRGRDGARGRERAPRRRPRDRPEILPGLRLAHLRRADARGPGAARRGRRRPAPARHASRPSSSRSPAGRLVGGRATPSGWRRARSVPTWPALAADRTRYGHDARPGGAAPGPRPARAAGAREPGAAARRRAARRDATAAADAAEARSPRRARIGVPGRRSSSTPSGSAHKSDVGGVRLGLLGRRGGRAAGRASCSARPRGAASTSAASSSSRWQPPASS